MTSRKSSTSTRNGSRSGNAINLAIRWAKLVNGDRSAQLTVQKKGVNGILLTVTDRDGRQLSSGSLARPPTKPPPEVPPYKGPIGERADWWWYDPFEPQPPTDN